jgi:hypothetical protein
VWVRADSPADARVVASAAEADFLENDEKPSHGASTRFASAFRDDKLYSVFEELDSEFSPTGERCVLRGEIAGTLGPEDA